MTFIFISEQNNNLRHVNDLWDIVDKNDYKKYLLTNKNDTFININSTEINNMHNVAGRSFNDIYQDNFYKSINLDDHQRAMNHDEYNPYIVGKSSLEDNPIIGKSSLEGNTEFEYVNLNDGTENCPICSDKIISDDQEIIVALKCNKKCLINKTKIDYEGKHIYHKTCIEKWFLTKRKCPLCMFEFN
jgi:hypothetical protein